MVYVVRYLLEGDGSIPKFVASGGFFPLGEELVGISVDDEKRYLPATVHKLTKAELQARVKSAGVKEDGSPLSDADAENFVQIFLEANNMEDYE